MNQFVLFKLVFVRKLSFSETDLEYNFDELFCMRTIHMLALLKLAYFRLRIQKMREIAFILFSLVFGGTFDDCPYVQKPVDFQGALTV